MALEKNPAQCFIAVDDEDLGSGQDTTNAVCRFYSYYTKALNTALDSPLSH